MGNDLRYALRSFLKSPGFTTISIVALALGVGANTAIFSIVYTLILKPLPYRDPGRLAVIWEHNLPRDRRNNVVSPGNYLHWREMNTTFAEMSVVSMTFRTAYTGDGEPEELPKQIVNATLFPMLGVSAAHGRVLSDADDRPLAPPVVLISDRLWKRRFAADPQIVNRTIRLDGTPTTIVGVMPAGFSILDADVDLWMPAGFTAQSRTPRGRWTMVVGRLKDGVTIAQAQSDMTRVASQLTRMFPAFDTGWTARVVPLSEQLTGSVRPALLVMLAAVALVLLIACANVANLLLARATTRQRELALRAALGADRRRLIRQLLAESAILAGTGGVAGLGLAWGSVVMVRAAAASRVSIPRLEEVALNVWVLLFALSIVAASVLFFGLVPAFTASRVSLTGALQEGGRAGTGGRGGRARQVFVIAEVALALILLVGAGLLARSFSILMRVDAGFDPDRIVTMKVTLPSADYRERPEMIAFFDRLFERIDAVPGVESSGGISFLPLTTLNAATSFTVEGQPAPTAGEEPVSEVKVVTHDYFRTMGIPLRRGRLFDRRDTTPGTRRIVVSESLARRYLGGRDPIGQRIVLSWNDQGPDEIIGVVGDVRSTSLEAEPRPASYLPPSRFAYPYLTVTVKSSAGMALVPSLVRAVHELDADVPVADIRSMADVMSVSTIERRLTLMLLAAFAVLALLLAAIGIYGVISYSVTQRTAEIGIRMALGAERPVVMRMVVGQAMTMAGVGVASGAAGAWGLTRLMRNLLFGVTPSDPATFTVVAAMLGLVAACAALVPALRATRVDPAIALRS